MAADVITIARTLGAGGEELGLAIAQELGFAYLDSEIVRRAADDAGVEADELARAEAGQSLFGRIRERLAAASADSLARHASAREALLRSLGETSADDQALGGAAPGFVELIRASVANAADEGRVVIVAHGAGIALSDREGTFRILVTAPDEIRAARVAEERGTSHREALALVSKSDSERAQFFQRFYSLGTERPTHYDLVLNTHRLDPDACVGAVVELAGHGGHSSGRGEDRS